jgi:hypothetical protein
MKERKIPPTIEDLRRYFSGKLERATFQVQQAEDEAQQAERESGRHSAGDTRWVNLSFWRGVQVAYKESLVTLDGIPEDS